MQQMSSRWLPAMLADTLEIVQYGQVFNPLATANNTPLATFLMTAGTVNVSSSGAVRRTLQQATMIPSPADPLALPVPQSRLDDLFPTGNELQIAQGCRYLDGTVETAQLGRFLMEDVEVYHATTSGHLYIQLNGSDRAATIARAQFTAPYSTDGVSALSLQIASMLNQQVVGLTFSLNPGGSGWPVPAQQNFAIGADPWASALAVAASVGFELFFDAFGTCVLRPVVDPSLLTPSAAYADDENAIVTDVQLSYVNTSVPNLVIMTSQGSNVDTPLQSVWWDNNPDSPTYYAPGTPPLPAGASIPGGVGSYPTTVLQATNSTATTQAANDAAAEAAFLAAQGQFERIDFKLRANAAHDVDDLVLLTNQEAEIIQRQYALDTITFQLALNQPQEMKGRRII